MNRRQDIPYLSDARLMQMAQVAMGFPQQRVRRIPKLVLRVSALMDSVGFRFGYAFGVLLLGVVLGLAQPIANGNGAYALDETPSVVAITGDETLEELTNIPWI
jgi:hypothetical protein